MYAIVKTGGKQYRVEQGQSLLVERLAVSEGDSITLDPLLCVDGSKVVDQVDGLSSVTVEARVVGHERGPKLRVVKFKPKRGYKRRNGHRQELTRLEVTGIKLAGGRSRSSAKSSSDAPAPVAAEAPAAEKPTAAEKAKAAAKPKAEAAEKPKPKAEAKPKAAEKPKAEVAEAAEEPKAEVAETAGEPKAEAAEKPEAKPKVPAKPRTPRTPKKTSEEETDGT
jgi:large subunit ribosomal protein L21